MSEVEKLFISSTNGHFPVKECAIPDENEPNVFYSKKLYTCLVIDTRFVGSYQVIHHCRPYICTSTDGTETLFGWLNADNRVTDNLWQSIHMDDECVIGFLDEQQSKKDLESRWAEFKAILDSQWD